MRCFLLVFLAGCAGVRLPVTTKEMAARAQTSYPGITVAELDRGRDLYLNRCRNCHTLVAPEAHAASEWPELVGAMKDRAELADDEQRLITAYLASATNH